MQPERLYPHDIVEAADDVISFTQNIDYDEFVSDRMRRSAVLQRLAVIGEAASHIGHETQSRYRTVPWRGIAGLRNVAVHTYFRLDWAAVCQTATHEIPLLRQQVAAILQAEFPDDAPSKASPPG